MSMSFESRQLSLGGLAVKIGAGCFHWAVEGLPGLADNALVGRNGAFGRHPQSVDLDPHVSGKLAFTLSGAIVADGTVEILVTDIIGGLGGRIARLDDGAGVELASAVRRAEKRADDPLNCAAATGRKGRGKKTRSSKQHDALRYRSIGRKWITLRRRRRDILKPWKPSVWGIAAWQFLASAPAGGSA